jgi:pimeloyl-ACP methyl ester carboxylesterase
LCCLLGLVSLVASCSDGSATAPSTTGEPARSSTSAPSATSSTSGPTTTAGKPAPGDIEWTPFDDNIDEGRLVVPLDYENPQAGSITLFMYRHKATDADQRIGSLLVNPGGPGFGGSDLALSATFVYGPSLTERFDIIGWDPRGTGQSEPAIDCVSNYDQFFAIDSSPDTPAEKDAIIAAADEFVAGCESLSGELLPHVSTANSARDMDAIRAALGEETISYFGFSYGSELGATWATMFPDTVRAIVIDGVTDLTTNYLAQNIQQATGFEASLTEFLDQCSADTSCAFHNGGDAAGAFDALAASIESGSSFEGRVPLTDGVFITAVAQAMYSEDQWETLAQALADAQAGNGEGLIDLYDTYYGISNGEGTGNELEAYFAIGCLDDPGSEGTDDLFTNEAAFAEAAPRLGRSWMAELTFCSRWPVGPAAPLTLTAKGAGPVVVIGTTGDPATPLDSTRRTADALDDGRLVVVTADQHTGYGVNDCVNTAVDNYLVDPSTAPPAELSCP